MQRYTILGQPFFFDPISTGFSLEDIELSWSEGDEERFRKAFRESEAEPTSYSFCLSVSDACNLACDYCFNKGKSGRTMGAEEAIAHLERLFRLHPDCEKYFVDLSGSGEPLLALKTVLTVAKWCKAKQDEIRREVLPQFVCNGTLLSPEVAKVLQSNGILFGVSLDGDERNHDSHRKSASGKATFKEIMANVSAIEHRQYVGVAVTLTDDAFPLRQTAEDLLKTFSTISFRPARGAFGSDPSALEAWLREYDILAESLLQDASNGRKDMFLALMNGEDFLGRYLNRAFGGFRVNKRCDAGTSRVFVGMDDADYVCPAASCESLTIPAARPLPDAAEECRKCPFAPICGGECEILLSREGGRPNQSLCRYKRHLILLANFIERKAAEECPRLHDELAAFAKEKEARNREDPELRRFLDSRPGLSFTEGKRMFDENERRY